MGIMKLFWIAIVAVSFLSAAASIKTITMRRFTTLLNRVTNNFSDKRPIGPIESSLKRSGVPDRTGIKSVKHPLYSVVAEMRADLETLQRQDCSELELDVRGSEYLDKISEYCYQEFIKRCGQYTHHRQYVVLKELIVEECTEACEELTRGFPDISYLGTLSELKADIDNYIDQIPPEQAMVVNHSGTLSAWRDSIWYTRSKWLLAQVLMLALNFGQYELHRRLSIRSAEKRLAEVPEFPLL